MILDTQKIQVANRTGGTLGYRIPEMNNLKRFFLDGETKSIEMGELRKLSWTPGGKTMIEQCLLIKDKDVVNELLNGEVEPEYYLSDKEVENLLIQGSLDELKDAIDFAPEGVVSLIKKLAVDLKIKDIDKRDAIFEMTGFDVTKAIEINKMTIEEEVSAAPKRRTEETKKEEVKSEAPVRRVIKK